MRHLVNLGQKLSATFARPLAAAALVAVTVSGCATDCSCRAPMIPQRCLDCYGDAIDCVNDNSKLQKGCCQLCPEQPENYAPVIYEGECFD